LLYNGFHFCQGQKSFYSGALILSSNFGTDGNMANQRYFNGAENTAQTLNGTAPSSDFSMGLEYGLLEWLGIGAIGRIDNYFVQQNMVTETSPTEGAADIGATANIHVLRWKHLDLFGGYDFGLSHLTYIYNMHNGVNASSVSNGTWSDIHATGRLYFSRLGINLSLYVPSMSYSSFRTSNTSIGEYTINYWKSTGYGASLGLQYRIF
jgi:hypothetical protein